MKAVYEVQTLNRNTGVEHWARVEAESGEAARSKVIALGEIVGQVRLAEVLEAESPEPATATMIPGVVTCPQCHGTSWSGGRSCLFWVAVILLFPIGLLLLIEKPTWRCARCSYTFRRYSAPVDLPSEDCPTQQHGILYQVGSIILYTVASLVAILGGMLLLGLLFG